MMSIQKIKEDLKKKLSSKRYEHTMGVEYTSTCLAMRYGADIEKARLAGLTVLNIFLLKKNFLNVSDMEFLFLLMKERILNFFMPNLAPVLRMNYTA